VLIENICLIHVSVNVIEWVFWSKHGAMKAGDREIELCRNGNVQDSPDTVSINRIKPV
jgi:hypothetical protein